MDDTRDTAQHGNRYGDDVKEAAYQLWAFRCSRRPSEVSGLLALGEIVEPVPVSARQIERWASSYAWAERVHRDLRAIAPDIRDQTIGEIIMGALDGARYLRAVADGRESTPVKERVVSSLGLIDRAGLSHLGRPDHDVSLSRITPAPHLLGIASLSDDQLDALERASTQATDPERRTRVL